MTPVVLHPRSPQPPPAPAVKPTLWRPVMSEAELQDAVIPLLIQFGFLVHHSRPARTNTGDRWVTPLQGHPGLPDLVFAKAGAVWLVELKRDTSKPTPPQQAWLDAGGRLCGVWRPKDLPFIREWVRAPFEVTG